MISNVLKVAVIGDDISSSDKELNLRKLGSNINKIASDTDLVVLPELFSTGFNLQDKSQMLAMAEKSTGRTVEYLHFLSQKYGTAICGSFLAHTAGQLYNRGFFIEPSGEETFYDKYHLFGIGGETELFKAGEPTPKTVRFRGWNIRLAICYDLRFPVWCRNVENEYDLMVVVANWPKSRAYSWRQLLIARAIENECYVCGANRSGRQAVLDFGNESLIVDFRGQIMVEQTDESPIIEYEMSSERLNGFRKSFPAWKDADKFELTAD